MKIPFVNFYQQYLDCRESIDQAIADTIASSAYITSTAPTAFETAFAHYTGAEDCAAVGSGTQALVAALVAAGIGPGHEVITTPMTFVSTTEAIVAVGATPVFVDIDADTMLMDVQEITAVISPRTKAVLFVDLYGQSPDLQMIRRICDQHGLMMIQDAAQSVGNRYQGQPMGNVSDLTCFSFNPGKNLGAMGDAGAVTGGARYCQSVRQWRDHGRVSKYTIQSLGTNARLDLLQQNILLAKLPHLESWLHRKREICQRYSRELADKVQVPVIQPGNTHSWYVYVIRVADRERLALDLMDHGVMTNIHYAQVTSRQPAFSAWHRPCARAERAAQEVLSLPCWYSMTQQQVEYVIDRVRVLA